MPTHVVMPRTLIKELLSKMDLSGGVARERLADSISALADALIIVGKNTIIQPTKL